MVGCLRYPNERDNTHRQPPPLMPEQPTMQLRLRIWQQNINRSIIATQHIINSDMHLRFNVITLQKPYLDSYSNTRASCHWRVVYPTTHPSSHPNPPSQMVLLINSSLNTNSWKQIPFPSPDITIVQLKGAHGLLSLFNIYVDCDHSNVLQALQSFSCQQSHII